MGNAFVIGPAAWSAEEKETRGSSGVRNPNCAIVTRDTTLGEGKTTGLAAIVNDLCDWALAAWIEGEKENHKV